MSPPPSNPLTNARQTGLSDPRVRALADRIIPAHIREIAQMQLLLGDLALRGRQGTVPLPAAILTEARKAVGR